MEAHSVPGDFYRQEFSLANAEDNAFVVSLDATVNVSAGVFHHCLKTEETTPREPDALEHKYYSAGVGNVLTVDVRSGELITRVQLLATWVTLHINTELT